MWSLRRAHLIPVHGEPRQAYNYVFAQWSYTVCQGPNRLDNPFRETSEMEFVFCLIAAMAGLVFYRCQCLDRSSADTVGMACECWEILCGDKLANLRTLSLRGHVGAQYAMMARAGRFRLSPAGQAIVRQAAEELRALLIASNRST